MAIIGHYSAHVPVGQNEAYMLDFLNNVKNLIRSKIYAGAVSDILWFACLITGEVGNVIDSFSLWQDILTVFFLGCKKKRESVNKSKYVDFRLNLLTIKYFTAFFIISQQSTNSIRKYRNKTLDEKYTLHPTFTFS